MIKILVDSAADITESEAKGLGIEIIPLFVRFGETEYRDGVDIYGKRFFEKLIESDEFPQTSRIDETRFVEKLNEMIGDGDEVIVITISSKLSGTFSGAKAAEKHFGGKVKAVDSLNASIGERILCYYAIRLVEEGRLSLEEIVKELNARKRDIQLLAVLDTLKYLKKGGRISALTAFTGEILSIKPVISIINGEIKLVGKAIGSKKSNNLLNQLVGKCGGIDFSMPYCTAYSGLSDAYLQKYIADSENLWKDKTDDLPAYMIGSAIGAHVGPNGIAVAFFAKK